MKKQEKKFDLLYIFGTGSKWNNNELRYSLRSVEKYFPYRRVFIVGAKPHGFKNIIHIPAQDRYTERKLENSIYKLGKAVNDPRLGKDFVLMNDDFFLLKPMKEPRLYIRGTIREKIEAHGGYYLNAMQNTMEMLENYGIKNPIDYELHYPMLLNKEKVREALATFDYRESQFLFRSVYGNLNEIGGEKIRDFKIHKKNFDRFKEATGRELISTDDYVVSNDEFKKWIASRFPTPSRFEEVKNEKRISQDNQRLLRKKSTQAALA